jgi:hypothetical protein
VYLVGFAIEVYYNARTFECQIWIPRLKSLHSFSVVLILYMLCFLWFLPQPVVTSTKSSWHVQVQKIYLPLDYILSIVWEHLLQHNHMLEEFMNDQLHQTPLHTYSAVKSFPITKSYRFRRGVGCLVSILTLTFGTSAMAELSACTSVPRKFLGIHLCQRLSVRRGYRKRTD